MRSITYSSLLQRIAGLRGEPRGLNSNGAVLALEFVNLRYRLAWEAYWWPEQMLLEQRLFRPVWDADTAYTAGTEVFFWPTRSYYVAARTLLVNQPPAEYVDGEWEVDTEKWVECQAEYSGEEWTEELEVEEGEVVYYPQTGRFYGCFLDAPAGTLPTDTNYYSPALTNFERRIDLEQEGETAIGEVREIFGSDPAVNGSCDRLDFELRGDSIYVVGEEPVVWVRFRKRCPEFEGEADEEVSYQLAPYVAWSVAGDLAAKAEGKSFDFTVDSGAGYGALMQEIQKIEFQQKQTRTVRMRGR